MALKIRGKGMGGPENKDKKLARTKAIKRIGSRCENFVPNGKSQGVEKKWMKTMS